jgi:hypothetical protein
MPTVPVLRKIFAPRRRLASLAQKAPHIARNSHASSPGIPRSHQPSPSLTRCGIRTERQVRSDLCG